jgi:hypothetical protein
MTGLRVEPGHIGQPDVSEYAPFYAGYIARVSEEPLMALQQQGAATAAALRRIPESSASPGT